MVRPETVHLGDHTSPAHREQREALNQLNSLLRDFDLSAVPALRRSMTDAQSSKELLPPLDIKPAEGVTISERGNRTVIEVTDKKDKKHETVIVTDDRKQPKEITSNGVTWTKSGDRWQAKDARGNPLKDSDGKAITADKISVRGSKGNTEIVIEQGAKTTVQRTDGSSLTETHGPNGSVHGEVRDSANQLIKVVHNGREFGVGADAGDGKKKVLLNNKELRDVTIDRNGVIEYKRGDLEIKLNTDGSTIAKNTKTKVETQGFGDGTRIYKDTSSVPPKLLGMRDIDRNYISVKGNKAEVRNSKGAVVPSELDGKEVVALDKPPGALKIKDSPAKNKETVLHLDKSKVIQEKDREGNVGPVEMKDAKGRDIKFTYEPPNSRNKDKIVSFKAPDGIEFKKGANTKEIKVDEERGQVTATLKDGSVVKYDLRAQTKTETKGDESTVKHFDKKYEEKHKAGQLQSLKQDGLEWQVTAGKDGKPEKIKAAGVEHSRPPAKSIDIKDGKITVVDEVDGKKTVTTYNPDRSVNIKGAAGQAVDMKLDTNGRPTQIKDDQGHVYRISRTGANIDKVTDSEGNPVKVNGKKLESPPYNISVGKDGKIEAFSRAGTYDRLVIDPLRRTTLSDTPSKAEINTPKGKVEITAERNVPTSAKIYDSKGHKVADIPIKLPPGITGDDVDWRSLNVNDSGQAVVKLKGDKGTMVVDPEKKTTVIDTKDKKTLCTERGRVEIEKKDGKPESAMIYDKSGKSFSAKYVDGKMTELKNERTGKVVGRAGRGVTLELDGDKVIAKRNDVAVTLHPDGSRDFSRGQFKHCRDAENWVRHGEWRGPDGKPQSADFEYHKKDGKTEVTAGQAIPERVRFGNGSTLTRTEPDMFDTEGKTKFVLKAGTPPREYKFDSATVDKKGVVHLTDQTGRKYAMTADGTVRPEQPPRPAPVRLEPPVRTGPVHPEHRVRPAPIRPELPFRPEPPPTRPELPRPERRPVRPEPPIGSEAEPERPKGTVKYERDIHGRHSALIYHDREAKPRYRATLDDRGQVTKLEEPGTMPPRVIAEKGKGGVTSIGLNKDNGDVSVRLGRGVTDRTVTLHSDGSRDVTDSFGRTVSYNSEKSITRGGGATFQYSRESGDVSIPPLRPDIAQRLGLSPRSETAAAVPESVTFGNGMRLEKRNAIDPTPGEAPFTLTLPEPLPDGRTTVACEDAAVDKKGNTHVIVAEPVYHPATGQPMGVKRHHYVIAPSGQYAMIPGTARSFVHKPPRPGRDRIA